MGVSLLSFRARTAALMPPSSQSWRLPIWVPVALAAISVVVLVCCAGYLLKRTKSYWPW